MDRMKGGQNDICYITDDSIAVVSSSSFGENLRKKGYEVPYMADPMDEHTVHRLKEFDGTKLKSTMKEELGTGHHDEKKTLEELNIESELLRILMKKVLGDGVEEAIENDRTALSRSQSMVGLPACSAAHSSVTVASNNSNHKRQGNQHDKRGRKKGEKGRREEKEREEGDQVNRRRNDEKKGSL